MPANCPVQNASPRHTSSATSRLHEATSEGRGVERHRVAQHFSGAAEKCCRGLCDLRLRTLLGGGTDGRASGLAWTPREAPGPGCETLHVLSALSEAKLRQSVQENNQPFNFRLLTAPFSRRGMWGRLSHVLPRHQPRGPTDRPTGSLPAEPPPGPGPEKARHCSRPDGHTHGHVCYMCHCLWGAWGPGGLWVSRTQETGSGPPHGGIAGPRPRVLTEVRTGVPTASPTPRGTTALLCTTHCPQTRGRPPGTTVLLFLLAFVPCPVFLGEHLLNESGYHACLGPHLC